MHCWDLMGGWTHGCWDQELMEVLIPAAYRLPVDYKNVIKGWSRILNHRITIICWSPQQKKERNGDQLIVTFSFSLCICGLVSSIGLDNSLTGIYRQVFFLFHSFLLCLAVKIPRVETKRWAQEERTDAWQPRSDEGNNAVRNPSVS